MSSSTAEAAVNGHSTVGPAYDRLTFETGYSVVIDSAQVANDRMGSRRAGTSDLFLIFAKFDGVTALQRLYSTVGAFDLVFSGQQRSSERE